MLIILSVIIPMEHPLITLLNPGYKHLTKSLDIGVMPLKRPGWGVG
jgi:hypothetical protein